VASTIEDGDRARQLARAIISDVLLYHRDKLAGGGDLTGDVDEGRRLFQSRAPRFPDLFEEALASSELSRYAGAAGAAPQPRLHPAPPPPAPQQSGSSMLAIAAVVVVIVVGLVVYLLRGH
jgi:hypothetical protein